MASFHVYAGEDSGAAAPKIRRIGLSDIRTALAQGFDDFWAMPSHLAFIAIVYPLCGAILAGFASRQNVLQLLFPLASGFALVGPFAAIGLYEMSRRRELGLDTSWRHALNVVRSPSIPSIAALGLILLALFFCWLFAAQALYASLYGASPPASLQGFLADVVSTSRGWTLMFWGFAIGGCFAAVALAISAVSFPLLLDRDAGLTTAVATSVAVVLANPVTMALWGLLVAAALVLGSLPAFLGLILVMPVLGHATWRLYRLAVERDPAQEHPVAPLSESLGPTPKERVTPHSFLFPER